MENLYLLLRGDKPVRHYSFLLRCVLLSVLFIIINSSVIYADNESTEVMNELLEMSIEELMDVVVTSSGRRSQEIGRASSAMYLITAEDIRNAGPIRHLGELMRLVPGMHVVEEKGSRFATGIRGLTDLTNQRYQFLMDGRPLYGALYGGLDLE